VLIKLLSSSLGFCLNKKHLSGEFIQEYNEIWKEKKGNTNDLEENDIQRKIVLNIESFKRLDE